MDELQFPLRFKCPKCGSERRIVETVMNQEKEKGKVNPNAFGCSRQTNIIVADPTKITISVPALIVFYDICFDCGTEYCFRVDLTTATPQMRTQQGPPMDMRRFGFPQDNSRLG